MNQVIRVAIPCPLPKLFEYAVPADCDIKPGCRVLVSFGRRQLIAVVFALTDEPEFKGKLKLITRLLDAEPVLNDHLLKMVAWLSDYYHYPIGDVCQTVLPNHFYQDKPLPPISEHYYRVVATHCALPKTATKQVELLAYLKTCVAGASATQIKGQGFQLSTVKTLQEKAVIEAFVSEQRPVEMIASTLALNDEQQFAVDAVGKSLNQFQAFLIEGVTGSGKTEVYLRVIEKVLQQGQQALVLVPEIGLTPQTVSRFEERFPKQCVVMHSNLTSRVRAQAWLKAENGSGRVVIGTRSSVFTPFNNLGVIIVDEEHDTSFKQQDGLRYHARDLAVVRAKWLGIPIVLGTATPSLESLHNVEAGRYQSLILSVRATKARAPEYHVIDLRQQKIEHGLSESLITAIGQHLAQAHQVLLFLNRRGFAPVLLCHYCGWSACCEGCDLSLTFHRGENRLKCHRCDVQIKPPEVCPSCHSQAMMPVGVGTERVEMALEKHFPEAAICRIDRDSTRRKNDFQQALDDILKGKVQILLGTQMLAKGHHFPRVAMVGILDVDYGLMSADFRALEKMGQLLVQVAGRAGRDKIAGHVYLQTHQPDNPLLQSLLAKGYHAFAIELLKERQQAMLPPYHFFAMQRVEAKDDKSARDFLLLVKQFTAQFESLGVMVLGPTPSPIAKVADRQRWQLLLVSAQRKALHELLASIAAYIAASKIGAKLRWSLDVDPVSSG